MRFSLSRRQFIGLGCLGGTAALLGSGKITTSELSLTSLDISIPHLPPAFEGYSVGFMSDIHLGPCASTECTEMAIDFLNRESPDLILLGGDYILMPDYMLDQGLLSAKTGKSCVHGAKPYSEMRADADNTYREIGALLATIRSKDGCYAVYGNHDLWVSPKLCKQHLEANNIKLLVNEAVTIDRAGQRLIIAGTDDLWAGVPRLPTLDRRVPGHEARIVLSHNPDFLSRTIRNSDFDFDLGLAGHTHGGQIRLPLIGAISYNIKDISLAEGLVQHQSCQTYTSRGIGEVFLPIRLNCPPEVTIFRLIKA